jgi:dihydroxyacetone kinase-like predicted kinase
VVAVSLKKVIALLDGRLATAGDDLGSVLLDTLTEAKVDQAELVTIYYGADLSSMQANQLADEVRKTWSEQEVEVVEGGQPHYQIILSVE